MTTLIERLNFFPRELIGIISSFINGPKLVLYPENLSNSKLNIYKTIPLKLYNEWNVPEIWTGQIDILPQDYIAVIRDDSIVPEIWKSNLQSPPRCVSIKGMSNRFIYSNEARYINGLIHIKWLGGYRLVTVTHSLDKRNTTYGMDCVLIWNIKPFQRSDHPQIEFEISLATEECFYESNFTCLAVWRGVSNSFCLDWKKPVGNCERLALGEKQIHIHDCKEQVYFHDNDDDLIYHKDIDGTITDIIFSSETRIIARIEDDKERTTLCFFNILCGTQEQMKPIFRQFQLHQHYCINTVFSVRSLELKTHLKQSRAKQLKLKKELQLKQSNERQLKLDQKQLNLSQLQFNYYKYRLEQIHKRQLRQALQWTQAHSLYKSRKRIDQKTLISNDRISIQCFATVPLLSSKIHLISGHDNGYVVFWNHNLKQITSMYVGFDIKSIVCSDTYFYILINRWVLMYELETRIHVSSISASTAIACLYLQ